MASPAVIAFHNAQMEQERKRVALRIANGTKASSNLVIGHRMQHPSYKGLPDNSTGSRIQPFFAAKDESHCPLEEKIRMRGGVLSTDAGQQYAKAVLRRRARDTENQQRMVDGLPPQPPQLLDLDEQESKSLELNTIIDAIDDALDEGTTYGIPLSEVSKLPRLLISLSPTFSENQITALIDVFDDLVQRAETPRSIRRPVPLGNAAAAEETVSVARLALPLARCLEFLKGALKIVNMANEQDRRIAYLALAKQTFKGAIKAKEAERLLPPAPDVGAEGSVAPSSGPSSGGPSSGRRSRTDSEFEREELGGPELSMQQLFPDIASIFGRPAAASAPAPPPSRRAAAAEDEDEDALQQLRRRRAAQAAAAEEEEAPLPVIRRRRAAPVVETKEEEEEEEEEDEEAAVKEAYDRWYKSLDSGGKKSAYNRLRYYSGKTGAYKGRHLQGAELYRMVAKTSAYPSERTEL